VDSCRQLETTEFAEDAEERDAEVLRGSAEVRRGYADRTADTAASLMFASARLRPALDVG
jgi:hypothetical protein